MLGSIQGIYWLWLLSHNCNCEPCFCCGAAQTPKWIDFAVKFHFLCARWVSVNVSCQVPFSWIWTYKCESLTNSKLSSQSWPWREQSPKQRKLTYLCCTIQVHTLLCWSMIWSKRNTVCRQLWDGSWWYNTYCPVGDRASLESSCEHPIQLQLFWWNKAVSLC